LVLFSKKNRFPGVGFAWRLIVPPDLLRGTAAVQQERSDFVSWAL